MVPVAGVDGCRGGWIVVTESGAFVCADFAAVLDALDPNTVLAIDIPIGLLDGYVAGGRDADRAARGLLGRRGSSVFSAPARAAFGAKTLTDARARGCPMTLQALNIMSRVEQVDRLMTPALQTRVFEVHPELCFTAMNGQGRPLESKRRRAGRDARRTLLADAGVAVPSVPRGAAEDDLLDAAAAGWGAGRIVMRTGKRVPVDPPLDRRGLRMEICW